MRAGLIWPQFNQVQVYQLYNGLGFKTQVGGAFFRGCIG